MTIFEKYWHYRYCAELRQYCNTFTHVVWGCHIIDKSIAILLISIILIMCGSYYSNTYHLTYLSEKKKKKKNTKQKKNSVHFVYLWEIINKQGNRRSIHKKRIGNFNSMRFMKYLQIKWRCGFWCKITWEQFFHVSQQYHITSTTPTHQEK